MRKSKQRREPQDPSILQLEIQHQETRAQLARSQCQSQRLEAQLAASRTQLNDLMSEIEYLRYMREREQRWAEERLAKFAAEVHALRHPVSRTRIPQRTEHSRFQRHHGW